MTYDPLTGLTEDGQSGWDPFATGSLPPVEPMEPLTIDWWLRRLNARLDRRGPIMRRFVDYYDGIHNVKLVSERFRAEFGRRFPEYADNFMPLVVDTEANRLHVQGVRYGPDRRSDPDAWRWWQANHLDADSALSHSDALLKGCTNVMVWQGPGDAEPKVWLEDAMQTVVDTEPGRRWERRAALKRWLDDDEHMLAELYLTDVVLRFRTRDKWTSSSKRVWEAAEWGGASFIRNPIGVVPIIPMINRPRLSRLRGGAVDPDDDGGSELATVIGNQDHINAYRMMTVVASEFASFRQRWAIGLDIPVDPVSGQPMEPFKPGVDRLWVVPPPDPTDYPDAAQAPRVQLGEFDQTDTTGLRDMIRDELRRLATKAQMPYHFLLESQTVPPSGESIKSAEASFVMKVEDAQVNFGEAWEEVFRLNFLWRNDPRANVVDAEVFWKAAESRADAVLTDSVVKAKSFGVADEIAQERWGMSPQEIQRNRELVAAQPTATDDTAPTVPELVNAAGTLIRSGFVAEDSMAALGLPPIPHTGLLPVTIAAPAEPPSDDAPAGPDA
jgi:hypothetical protein